MGGPRGWSPIGHYGLIGDGRTAALCSADGSIDWLCLPRFDSEPVFGRLLTGAAAGCFSIRTNGVRNTTRRYREGSALLETTWRTQAGEISLTEGMLTEVTGAMLPRLVLVRRLMTRGSPGEVTVRFDPLRGLPGEEPRWRRHRGALIASWGSLVVGLQASTDVSIEPARDCTLALHPGKPLVFTVTAADREPLVLLEPRRAGELLESTHRWWRGWTERLRYAGPEHDSVVRSLITLRLLTYSPSGAPVAAPTTSLPEAVGGRRNWDYRFSWPRDASLGTEAFLALGMPEEAHSYNHWLLHANRLTRPRLHAVYTLDGSRLSGERELDGVVGYRDSGPVRIGNAASTQHQLDVYGWVVDAAWMMEQGGRRIHAATWRGVSGLADFVAQRWRAPDAGIWELRGEPEQRLHSKLMAWLTLDRALRLAGAHGVREARRRRWWAARDAVASEIRERGFDVDRNAYAGSYGGEHLDAAVLEPVVEFEEPSSPRLAGTIRAIVEELSPRWPLLYRYPPGSDGLEGSEGAFLACSFWLVKALARSGPLDEAQEAFHALCRRANDVGLFAEEVDPSSGELLGNFPQALSHASLVQAAIALQDASEAGAALRASPRTRRAPGG